MKDVATPRATLSPPSQARLQNHLNHSGFSSSRMNPIILQPDPKTEFLTPERCWILESWNNSADGAVSIARARVTPGVTTQWHCLRGVNERYVIVTGSGLMRTGTLGPTKVGPGDIVVIPADVPQQITNDGSTDLIFFCICTPPFTPGCYESLETSG